MKPEKSIVHPPLKNLAIVLAFLVLATLIVGTSLFATVSAQKGVTEPTEGKQTDETFALLQQRIEDGTFEKMSSAAQQRMLLLASARYEDGELKKVDFPDAGSPILGKDSSIKPNSVQSPLSAPANVLVNNRAADATAQKTQSETSILITSATNLVAGFNDSGQFLGGVQSFTGYATSTDMGATWTDRGTPPPGTVGTFGDPSLARDNVSGRVYYATLAGTTNGINVAISNDAGVTFGTPVNGAPGTTAANGDKEWITVDNFGGAGQGNVYLTYRDFVAGGGVRFTRSTDGGATFGPGGGVVIANEGSFNVQLPWVVVGADHAVYVFWIDQSAGSTTRNIQRVRKSTDQGVTFGAAVDIIQMNTAGVNGSLGAVGGFRTGAFPEVVTNPTNANHLMIVYNDINVAAPGVPTDRGDVYFQQSTDGGATWSARTKVNTDATTRLNWSPAIAIQPDGANICVSWYDRRSSATDTLIERWGRIGAISGTTVTFGPDFAISNAQFPAFFGQDPVVNSTYMGDYDQVVADLSFFYLTWGDNRLGDADVRFAKVSEAGPGPVLGFTSAVVSGGNGNSTLEIDECADLTVTVTNNGTSAATGISGTLTTSTAGVLIQNGTQPYPDLAVGASGANAAPFKISVPANFVCGTPIDFTLTLTYTGGSDVLNFSLPTTSATPNNYTFTTSMGETLTAGGTLVPGSQADDAAISITLPFTYTAYGQAFTTARVVTNGRIQFTTASTDFTNTCPLPGTATDNVGLAFMPHWDDLIMNRNLGTDGIFTQTTGVAPNRVFIVKWIGQLFSTTGSTVNFEARLFEGTQRVDFIYGTNTNNGLSASIGVQRANAPTTFFTSFSCNTASLSSGLGISFTAVDAPCPTGGGACPTGDCIDITCPANITVSTDPNLCTAVVNYPAPTPLGTCTITCVPASGSAFPKGTTTVTCSETGGTPSCTFTVTVNDTQPPTITCPANITVSNDTDQCGAVVNYAAPTVSDNCPGVGAPVCAPASGSFFPIGTTTVTCTVADASTNTASCTFTVTVNDTQPPTIVCPPNQTAVTDQSVCPSPTCLVVTFPPPTATDNCPGVTVACVPPSGGCLPIGVTTVTCTATDASGNTATCSFTITVFDVAIQDDSDPSIILLWNSITGQYRFCCRGTTFTGVGKSIIQGCVYTLQHNPLDRRVLGRVDKAAHAGSGSIQAPPGKTLCTITDRNTLNDTNLTSCQ